MAPKIFFTGATGYIGGDLLHVVSKTHPEWQIRALVRSDEKGQNVAAAYSNVHIVKGTLDSADIIEQEVKDADIVFHMADCDHAASSEAIARGMTHHTEERPGWWIHTSGTGILTWEDFRTGEYGFFRNNAYDDWEKISQVTSLPDDALHREVDKIVLRANSQNPKSCKTAILAPPMIYGPSRGPCNRRSIQTYELAKTILKKQKGFKVGTGENVWHQVHVQDLSNAFLALGEAAAAGGGKATWGAEGYYFAESGQFKWGDIATSLTKIAKEQGRIASADVEQIDGKTADEYDALGAYMWGTNSIGHAIRTRKLLGWEPKQPSVFELLPSILDEEAKALSS